MKQITVAAAIIVNTQNQLLLVRKKNTQCFMQVGGKLEVGEAPEVSLVREIEEETGCKAQIEQFIGRFETATANEPDHQLISYVYYVKLEQEPQIQAEIAEMIWLDIDAEQTVNLAPLTQQIVIPWIKQSNLQPA
jgi:8-oxo-dGTP diphosphatase